MASDKDDVLSIGNESESFSGFSSFSDDDASKNKKKLKSKVVKKAKNVPAKKTKSSSVGKTKTKKDDKTDKAERPGLDISSLSAEDISNLRGLLGIPLAQQEEEMFEEEFSATPLQDRPRLTIEVENENYQEFNSNVAKDFSQALFEEDEEENWELPKLRVPEKGKPVSQSLAKLINMACTSQCDVDSLLKTYNIPENCEKAYPPSVNPEIWKILDKRAQSQDRALVDVQSLVAASITPIIKLAETLKPQIVGNSEAKGFISNALTLLGQVQFNLSLRRRYAIRPSLKKKYHSLCNISMPITGQLFGDDIGKDIKACDAQQFIGKDQGFRPQTFRGRGRFPRRPYGMTSNRFQPYPSRGSFRPPQAGRGYNGPKRGPTATVTSPNEKM